MPGNTMDWKSVETWERLVASIIATGVKLDLNMMAQYYGTTYNTLENRFRKIKKEAEELKAALGEVEVASPAKATPKSTKKTTTPKKDPMKTVASGRVSKKKSPAKKDNIKQEPVDDDDGSLGDGDGFETATSNAAVLDDGADDEIFN